MPINATWHRRHPMRKRPTLAQRIDWHLEHAQQCACRPIPANLEEAIAQERGRGKTRVKTGPTRPRAAGKARKGRVRPDGD